MRVDKLDPQRRNDGSASYCGIEYPGAKPEEIRKHIESLHDDIRTVIWNGATLVVEIHGSLVPVMREVSGYLDRNGLATHLKRVEFIGE